MANWYGSARSNYFKVKDVEKFKKFISKWGGNFIDKEFEITTEECNKCLGGEINKDCEHFVKRTVDHCKGKKIKETLYGFLGNDDSGSLPNFYADENKGIEYDFDDFLKELATHLEEGWIAVMQEVGAEKLRYITGFSTAVNSKGEIENVDISEIYERAEKLGKYIERCEY